MNPALLTLPECLLRTWATPSARSLFSHCIQTNCQRMSSEILTRRIWALVILMHSHEIVNHSLCNLLMLYFRLFYYSRRKSLFLVYVVMEPGPGVKKKQPSKLRTSMRNFKTEGKCKILMSYSSAFLLVGQSCNTFILEVFKWHKKSF